MLSLERYLAELPKSHDKLSVLQNIKNVLFHGLSLEDLTVAAYFLFSKSSKVSLLGWLESCIRNQLNEPLAKEREAAFIFIKEILEVLGVRLADYAVDICRVAFDSFRKELKSATLKTAALDTIIKLAQVPFPMIGGEHLNVHEIARTAYEVVGLGTKLGVTFRGVLLKLLGVFAERFPGSVVDMVRQLLALFVETLMEQLNSKAPEPMVLASALDGLSGLLVHSRGDFSSNPRNLQIVYRVCMAGLVPPEGASRYELNRSVLRTISKHADLFAEYLTEDCEKIFVVFTQGPKCLCRHNNKDLRVFAYKALDAFLKQVNGQLCSGKRNPNTDKANFAFFIKKFFEMIQSEVDSRAEIEMAISGFGAFAPAIARFLGQNEVKNVLHKLFQLSDRVMSGHRFGESQDRTQIHLGSFIQTFAMLVMQLDDLDDADLQKLGQLTRKLFDVFPLMFPKQRKKQSLSISYLFIALYSKGSCLRTLMAEIAKQCLVLTCSSESDVFGAAKVAPQQQDGESADAGEQNDQDQVEAAAAQNSRSTRRYLPDGRRIDGSSLSVKPWMTYLPLWRVMLSPLPLRDVDFPDDFRNEVSGVVYDELMRAIMALLTSLNLTFVEAPAAATAGGGGGGGGKGGEDQELGGGENMVMQYPADHEILQNLVSFCEDLLQNSHQNLFCRRWVFLFGEQLIHASSNFPLVAGFYRLMAVVFRVCESQRYFQGLETDATSLLANVAATVRAQAAASSELVSASGVSAGAFTTRDVTFVLFSKFVREILSRSQQFKDELLAAAVSLALAVPREFLDVSLVMPSLEMAFRMGLVFEPLARLGLDALEHWMLVAPGKVLPHLHMVLPLLGDFLTGDNGKESVPQDQVDGTKGAEVVKLKFRKKQSSKKEAATFATKSMSVEIQHRILGVLGMMGGHNEAILTNASLDNDQQSTAWDPVRRIKLKIGLSELIAVVHLDELLPRIVFLAESSPDRATKVAACELLHTMVLYMIGLNSTDPSKDKVGEKASGTNFSKIYERVFPAVLRLATDLDVVAKQLFYTLTFQCICWFTGNKTPESPETMALLNAIVAAVGDEHSSALRAFGARCIGEFYRCSQKRGGDQVGAAASNFLSLLRRVYHLAHQPSPFSRLGAVMAFAQIYKEFRGSVTLVREHLLDMTYEMLQSLRAAHQDPEAVGTADKASFVIRQLARVAIKYGYKVLAKAGGQTSRFQSIGDFVTFLSGEISSRETKYRKECMALLFDFVKLLPESRDSGAVWLASKPKSFLRDMTEKNLARFIDDVSIELLSSNEGLLCVLSFFESLTASLESLGWLLRHSFISDIKVVLKSHESTSVFRGINRLMREFGSDSNAVPALRSLTPAEQSPYRLLCAQAVLRVFRFLLLLIEKEPQWFGESKLVKEVLFGSDDFFRRLFECILDPTTASAGNDELFKSFPVYTSSLVKHLEMTKDQHAILERTLVAHNVFLLNPADPKVNLVAGSTLCAGLQRLSDLVKDKLKQPARAYVLDQSVQFSSSGVLTPAQSLLATEMLSLSLDLDCVTPKEVIQLLLRTDSIAGAAAVADGSPSSTSSVAARRSVGSLWYEAFQAPIDKFLLSHWERLGGIVVTQMRSNVVMMSVVFSLLKKCGSRPRISAPKALPVCKYGALCYRLSASHRAKYFHPSSSGGDSEEASQQQRQIEGVRAEQQEEEHWTEKFKSGFMNLICEHVEELAVWTRPEADQRSKECLMDLVSEMLRLDAHRVLLPRSKSRQFCAAVAEKFLARPLPLSFKNRAMKFVGPLLKMLPDQEVFGIMEGLRSVTVYDFPVKSTDLVDGSPAYNEYIVSIETLLTLLRESCNMRILELLYPVLRDTDHRHAERIHHFLMLFVNSLDEENCKMVFRMCYQTLMDPTQPHMLQYVLVTRLCVPILLRSEPDVVLDLFLDYVLQLVENIPTDANITSSRRAEPGPAKRHAGGEGAGAGGSVSVEHNLVVQVCSFDLLREFYKLVPRALIHGQVNEKYCSSLDSKKKLSGNELTIRVSSAAYNAKVTTHHVGHGIRPELLRQYHQSAFNCLAAVVICTQTKEDLYANLLLEEKSKKGEFFWANVIDTTVVWTFEVSTNYLVLRKPVSEVRPENDLMLGGSLSMNHAERRTLLFERFLGSSSLEPSSQSGSNAAGFWSSSVMAGGGGGGRGGIAGGRGVGDGNLRGSDSVGFSLALSDDDSAVKTAVAASANVRGIPLSKVAEEYEFDVVNSNPCMPTMLHVIDVLFEKNKYSDHGSMPVWMSNLVRVMENSSLHPNVRLFVGKIFVNRMELFAPWGQKHLLGPLLRLCVTTESMATVRSMQGEESAVTYYVRDLCIMMLRFGKPSRDLRALTTQFVTWFIKKIPSKNSAVLKENVRLFSFFYRQWEDCFDLDKTLLIAMLKQSHATWGVMMRAVGLRLTSLIMESRRLPIEPADCRRDPELDEMEFYRSLVANLDHKSLRIYAAAAEVCGELVSALNHADSDSAPRFSNSVREVVMAMFARKELDRAVVVLQQLAEKCPEFVDGFFGKLFDCLGTLTGEFKLAALEIVQKRSEVVPNLMPQLRGHLIPLLENRDARTQLLALQLALSLLNRMDDAFLSQVVAALSVFPTHQSVECRRKAYQLLMAIWGGRAHLREDRTLRVALLKGLSDPEEKKHILPNVQYTPEEKEKILNEKTISEMMLAFWTSKDMLTEGCMDRLEEMLSLLYEPEVERDWLSFAPAMLLKLSLDKKDYVQQKLFDYPLEQGAQFVEVKINTSSVVSTGGVGGGGGGGGGGSLPYTPAFSAGSQDSEYLSMDAFVSSARTDGQKRATAAFGEIVWTPSMSVSNDPAVVPKKSMLKGVFKMNDLPGQPQASVPKDVAFGQISVDDKNTVYRRFRKPTATLSSSFDMTAHLKRKQQVAVEKRVLESILAGMVPLSRTYLMGELPNIGISMEDFLVPMCQIAARDHAFASALLALVIDGAITALPSSQREQRQESLRGLISSCLSQTTQCNGAFVSCLLRVCYSHTGLVIDDLLVGNVALKSSSYHSGAMVLEKQIDYRRKNAPKQAASKRRKKEDSHLEAAVGAEPGWKPLAALFKVLGDDDVLTGICDKQLAQHSYTHDAIFKELQGDYGGALAVYNQGAEAAADATFDWKGNVPLLDELNLWEDGRLECLTHLTRWSELAASAKTEADFNLDNLWSPDLESYRQIFVQAAFRQRDQWQDLAQFVDDALSKPERGEWLLKNFGTQLAMMSMIRDDLDQAKSLISKSMKNVLESWRSLHPLARNGRLRLVQSLQQLKEIEEVVTFVRDEKNFSSMKALEGLLQRWEVRWPRETTSIVVWDSVAYCRSLLLDKVQQRFANSHQLERQHQQYGMQWPGQASQESVESAIADARVSYWRKCMRAGMKQHNLEVAKTFHNLCNEAEAVRRSLPSSELQSSLNDLPSLCLAIKLEEKRSWHLDSPEAQVRSICNSIVGLQSTSAASDELLAAVPRNFLQYHRLIAKLYLTLFDFLKANKGPILADLVKLACRERVIPETENGNLDGAVRSCLSTAYRHLNSAYRNAAKDLSVEYTAKTYMHMGRFCDRMLDENSKRTAESRAKYAKHVVEPILAAMALGSREASDMVPKVLVLLSNNRTPMMQAAFEKGVEVCQPWMFIRWISFLLSNLSDSWMAERVLPLLTKIAKDYPLAVYYPFNLSSDVKFLSKESQKLVMPLRKALHFPALEQLMFHLMLLQHPEHRFGDWLGEVKRMRKKKEDAALLEDWRKFYDLTLDVTNNLYGAYNAKFANMYLSKILKLVGGEDGRELVKKSLDERALNDLLSKAKDSIPNRNSTRKEDLILYSKYLADYDYTLVKSSDRSLMEIPGQYANLTGKPDPESHIRISSFGDKILSMGSIRKPKKLVMIGTNQKTYSWLVKGGEDLRQDQRVEELWLLMNDLLRGNALTSARGLRLETYQVVPMSMQLGLVEWVEGTAPVKSLLEDELKSEASSKRYQAKGLTDLPACKEHSTWLDKFADPKKPDVGGHALYHQMVVSASRQNAVAKWERQMDLTEPELLRRAVAAIACTPESYLTLRNGFARSLACVSIAGYVAGIGDRHLDNLLVNLSTGLIVAIDFGHAFGSATFQLGIPELVPFRLTPQLVNFLDPIGPHGLLVHNMTHVMSCFVEHRLRLLNLMEIFLKEPHMDWIKHSEKNPAAIASVAVASSVGGHASSDSAASAGGSSVGTGVVAAFAERRLKLVRDKLQMRNPAYITCDELNENTLRQSKPQVIEKLKEQAMGYKEFNFRARIGEKCGSVAQQVEALVDQATDPNILSRFWLGWLSYC